MKLLKYITGGVAATVAISYLLGYDYLWSGIAKTYLRGKTSANIDDEKLFPSNTITAAAPKPWRKDSLYNKTQLPKNIVDNLNQSHTASFLAFVLGVAAAPLAPGT